VRLIFILFILLIYLFFILQRIAFFTLLERHWLGKSQNRIGPNKVSYLGVLQPIVDGVKLIKKEQVLIFNCTPSIFIGITILNFCLFYLEFLTLPYYFGFLFLNWRYLLIIIIVGFNLICLLIGGFYSKRKYSFLGSIRSSVSSISYEIQFNLNMILFILYYKSFLLYNIKNFGVLLIFFTFFISVLVELGRTPFDYSESERELVSGFNTEYRRVGFVLLFLKEYGSLLFFRLIINMVFFSGYFIGFIFFFCLIIIVRSSFPRYRVDHLIELI